MEGLKELGIFGLMIPEEYDGLGESLLTYALCVEEIARGWMSVSGVINTHILGRCDQALGRRSIGVIGGDPGDAVSGGRAIREASGRRRRGSLSA